MTPMKSEPQPSEGVRRNTIVLVILGLGFSSWTVFLGGLASIHSAIAQTNSTLALFDTFSFSWFLTCLFLALWTSVMLCWVWGSLESCAKTLTPIIAIVTAWFGLKIQDILRLTLVAFRKGTMEGRFLVWVIGGIACTMCLAAMLIVLASWEPHGTDRSVIKAFHSYQHHKNAGISHPNIGESREHNAFTQSGLVELDNPGALGTGFVDDGPTNHDSADVTSSRPMGNSSATQSGQEVTFNFRR